MKNRRTFLMGLAGSAVALGIVVLPSLADDLYGRITNVELARRAGISAPPCLRVSCCSSARAAVCDRGHMRAI